MFTDQYHTTATRVNPTPAQLKRRISLEVLLLLVLLTIGTLRAAPALADYEQAKEHFGTTGEAAQLESATAITVNTTGAGGVEPGSIYVVGRNARVVRYAPGKEGEEPAFKEAWGWGVGDGKEEYERCGPALTTKPEQHTFNTCTPADPNAPFGGEQVGHFNTPTGVAVDQTTGDVYVRNERDGETRVKHLIETFTALGAPVGEGFGELGRYSPLPAESIGEGPGKLHEENGAAEDEGLAVDESGVVYVTDREFPGIANPPGEETRVMSFEPEHPGDYEHYVYAGQATDISAVGLAHSFSKVATAGRRIIVATQEEIREYEVGNTGKPVCTYPVTGQLQGMTANPTTGEVFYFTFASRSLNRLEPCQPSTGEFTVGQAPIAVTPETKKMNALAVDPDLSWGPLRPEGVLYAVDSELHRKVIPEIPGVGDVLVPAKGAPATVGLESVSGTTVDSTVLRAEINPNGFTTHYRFQYVNAAAYAAQKARAEGEGKDAAEVEDAAFAGALEAPAGSGGVVASGGVGVAATGVSGLAGGAEYRFRVVASSLCEGASLPACVTYGEPTVFSTYPSLTGGVPDGRVYELVSPPEKHGGEAFPADPLVGSCKGCKPPGDISYTSDFVIQGSSGGERVAYSGFPFSPSQGAAYNEYFSQRSAAGWQTTDLTPAVQATSSESGSIAFDTGLGRDLVAQKKGAPVLSADAPVGYQNLYVQETGTASVIRPMVAVTPPDRSAAAFTLAFAGATPDLSRAFFSANDALTGATAFAPQPPDPGSAGVDLYEWHEGTLGLVNVLPGNTSVAEGATFPSTSSLSPSAHGVSVDGSHVFWTATGHLYVRVDGRETLEVSSSGRFLAASPNGLEVLLSDGTIIRYDTETEVYEPASDVTGGQGGFQGVAGIGDEHERFSDLYFVDGQALPGSGTNERGQSPRAGQNNLYEWLSGETRFVVTLGAHDESSSISSKDWNAAPVERTAESSPNGEWFAFMSESKLTGYDNETPPSRCLFGAVGESVGHCAEVFLYDSATRRLSCVSCDPTGEAPRGPSTLRRVDHEPLWLAQPYYLTDAGRLVFDSSDRLSAADSNGAVEDVYEYEPDGVGSCATQSGCVLLVSPGTGSVDSNFLAMDETGNNVFFTTRERLVAQDKDELIDVYDARVGGGFASQTETQRSECQGEACQGTPAPPVFTMPGSATFSGAGNLIEPITTPVPAPIKQKKASKTSMRTAMLRKCRTRRSKRKRAACEKHAHGGSRHAHANVSAKRGTGR